MQYCSILSISSTRPVPLHGQTSTDPVRHDISVLSVGRRKREEEEEEGRRGGEEDYPRKRSMVHDGW